MPTLEFFFDCSSPWTYLAFHRIEELARAGGAELLWKPILVGGVFNAVNPAVYEARANPNPRRAAYQDKDLADWARLYGLTIEFPDPFPVNSVKVMRGCFVALEEGCMPAFARAVFEAYWGEGRDISEDAVLADLAKRAGIEPEAFFAKITSAEYKRRLRDTTDELIERGGFGSPTIFLNGTDMYFGNDRLVLIEDALARTNG